jgi:hypothetical protein
MEPLPHIAEAHKRQLDLASSSAMEVAEKSDLRMTMRLDPVLYENARKNYEDELQGGNVWDEPEFVRDMMERHPEICTRPAGIKVRMPGDRAEGVKPANRHGRLKSRTRFSTWQGRSVRIEEDYVRRVRVVRCANSMVLLAEVCMDSGKVLQEAHA